MNIPTNKPVNYYIVTHGNRAGHIFPCHYHPSGTLPCAGQFLPKAKYAKLYEQFGEMYSPPKFLQREKTVKDCVLLSIACVFPSIRKFCTPITVPNPEYDESVFGLPYIEGGFKPFGYRHH